MGRWDAEIPRRRASDADRDRAVGVLRDAAVDGRLPYDSFVWRVDRALQARNDQSLVGLVADLTPPHPAAPVLDGLVSLAKRLRSHNRYRTLPLPDSSAPVVVIGRKSDCDFVITDDSTSRIHAALMLYAGRWYVTDRGSTNGTGVNGRRIWGTATIRVGDLLSFGQPTLQLVPPSRVGWGTTDHDRR